jgi:hypothetical protein
LNITVRRIASGVGVERTFKVHSPRIEKIEVVRHGVSNRAQLYFLRDRVGKQSSLRERRDSATAAEIVAEAPVVEAPVAEAPVAEAVEASADVATEESAPVDAPAAEASEKAPE